MRHVVFVVAVLLSVQLFTARAQDKAPPEFTLRLETQPADPLSKMMQWPFRSPSFYLVVRRGEAFLSQTEEPPREVDKLAGKLDIVLRTGIDPASRQFKDPILRVAFHYAGSGWAADKFITDIVVPFSLPQKPDGTATFSESATMTLTWEVASQGSLRTIADPMNARFEQTLKCTTVKVNFSPKTK